MDFSPLPLAHIGHGTSSTLLAGLSHPFGGLDHVLAMVALGVWAAQQQGKALWALPSAFVGSMLAAAVAAMLGLPPLLETENGILASLLILGVLIALIGRFNLALSCVLAAVMGFFHGYAHGMEFSASGGFGGYVLGFALATASLHACGMAGVFLLSPKAPAPVWRFVGTGLALGALGLWVF